MKPWLTSGLALGLLIGLAASGSMVTPSVASAGPPPGMPDPASMSGIPRPDPNLSPGTVTVRCLNGSFANPALGVEVELEISTAAGPQTRTATSADQGRAVFSGLDEFFGASVVAKATVAGQQLRSQSFVLGPQAGFALLLVATSEGAAPATGPGQHPGAQPGGADPHGGQGAVPVPGQPFPLDGRPRGTLIVGALDLSASDPNAEGGGIGPIADVEVTLTATVEGAEPIVEVLTTGPEGRAMFEGLDTRLPEGAQIVVEAVLEPEGAPQRSQSFTLGDTAYAIVLTRGAVAQQQPAQQPPSQPQGRLQLPGPRVDKTLDPGQVRVFIVDAFDRPVAGQAVVVHSSEATGDSANRTGRTDEGGMVVIDEVPVEVDMLSQVRVVYEGAPYSSTLFEMPEDAGAIVMLRVFRPTGDRTRVRSALQIDVSPRENDFAAVSFNYAVFVDGDEAFWVPGGMTIYGPPDTRSLHVMEESKAWLMHDGETPWVELDRPLEPGAELRLSFAVGLEHDGSLEIEWSTPFPLVEDASLVSVPEELAVTHGVAGAPEVNPHAGRDGGALELYELGYQPFALGVCDLLGRAGQPCPIGTWGGNEVSVIVEGLPTRSRVWPYTAWGLLGFAFLGIAVSMVARRRVGAREALLARRDALVAELVALDQRPVDSAEVRRARARILRTLDRIYRQIEVL
ncbi:hypothetical protein ENSA5_30570 [Enhygromyxa salina]|uniref:Carboxypeptidase regulatory-like domain-containing protein n=1 Tax=Enhygromyxa salina TaxID=215803 RepID=A0A2S9XZN7_9BACT|nr:Ig-like domain-containing protein [Enhygromyxa salina]PRP98324.1 hypothetical protein ENSA5_30570 [Enhygromyxa salina]